MTEPVSGPFNGLIKDTNNGRLAEIWIEEKGSGHEFTATQFAEGTGIVRSSAMYLLNRLTEAGILACYQHPQHKGQSMFRVAWPVTIVNPPKPAPTLAQRDYQADAVIDVYHVSLSFEEEELITVTVEASSPAEAAALARENIKARVSLEWHF